MKYNYNSYSWIETKRLNSRSFSCWNCGENIASEKGYPSKDIDQSIYICHKCNAPNIFDSRKKNSFKSVPGKNIKKLPLAINTIYNEARSCLSVEAYTGAIMLFRKILMNIAVEEGADEDKNFKYYVKYLCDNGFVHKRQIIQADKIRNLSNDANHQIESRTEEEANEMLKFIEFLLLNNYEFADEKETKEAATV